ncbi:MAG: hypothetical protein ACC631_04680 [Halocynthiibacter sp.]
MSIQIKERRAALRLIAGGAMAISMAVSGGSAQAQTVGVSGFYKVTGLNADGTFYQGTVNIVESADGTVQFAWSIRRESFSGTGVREGRIVTVDWGQTTPVIYVVMKNGELHGTWDGGLALELLTVLP